MIPTSKTTEFRPLHAQGNDNRVRVTDVQRLVEAVSWVDEIYPDTDRDGAAVVNVTWDHWNELRAALNLPRQPTPKDRKAWKKRSAESV